MTLQVSLLVEAADEFDAATDWYDERQPGLGASFRNAVKSTLSAIADNPRRFPRAFLGVRRAVLSKFPFSVYFTVEPEGILVVAVFHGARDLQQVKDRI